MKFTTAMVKKMIESYTREAGVRQLERLIAAVCRSRATDSVTGQESPTLTMEILESILGVSSFFYKKKTH